MVEFESRQPHEIDEIINIQSAPPKVARCYLSLALSQSGHGNGDKENVDHMFQVVLRRGSLPRLKFSRLEHLLFARAPELNVKQLNFVLNFCFFRIILPGNYVCSHPSLGCALCAWRCLHGSYQWRMCCKLSTFRQDPAETLAFRHCDCDCCCF